MLKNIKLWQVLFVILAGFNHALAAIEQTVSLEHSNIAEAQKVVTDFQSELLAVMRQGQTLDFQGRYDRLQNIIIKTHDLTKIARIVVGREWINLTDEQKQRLVKAFSRLSISAYAYNFKTFDGERFEFLSAKETKRGGVVINTLFVLPHDKDVKFDYMLKKKGDSWKIINVIANGVSDLALKRSEYTSILKREGFEPLIAKINQKTDNYATRQD